MAVKRSLEISNPKDPSAAKTMADATPYEDQSVLVEGPGPGEAEFLGRWLLAVAAADRTLQEQFKRNTALKGQIRTLEIIYEVRFSSAATRFLELLMKDLTAFTLSIKDNWIEPFSIMADLGFFRLTGERYQMTVPYEITGSRIEAALLKLAATEERYSMHPEHLVHCVTESYAQAWQSRLKKLPWMQRVADRNILLDDADLDVGRHT
jgi:hypothetical protein